MPEKNSEKKAATQSPAKKTANAAKSTSSKSAAKSKPVAAKQSAAAKPAVKPAAAETKRSVPQSRPSAPRSNIRTTSARNTVKNYKARSSTARARRSAPARGRSGGVAAILATTQGRVIAAVVAFALLVGIVLGIVLSVKSCKGSLGGSVIKPPVENIFEESEIPEYNYDNSFKSTTVVGFSSKQIGTVTRNVPKKTENGGLSTGYPVYGSTLSGVIGGTDDKKAMRDALIAESNYLCANGTSNASGGGGGYDRMDARGFLYLGDEPALDKKGKHRQLYKHSAAEGMYLGNVSDNEQAVIKQVTMRPRGYNGYGVTGIYAPAGEVIKIRISEADMEATGGLTIHIGQALYNGQANNIWTAKNQMQRFPVILNTMTLNKTTATLGDDGYYTGYVGSFLGGPLYIRNTNATFTATISGGVPYPHFILGYTTKEEFEQNAKSSAPYFDLEVWRYGVLHSGPKRYAQNFSYEDLYKAAILWEKVSSVTTTGSSQGIVFLYDAFVAAGAAVAFPGRRSVNCPLGWMSSSLNYNSIVTSGSWGNFHEYHHNFQGYGVGNGGEVTNNGMTLVSYALFTKISAARRLNSYGAEGLGGWNSYTSATWALDQVMSDNPSNGRQGLSLYATLLHNFGPDAYIQSKVRQQSMHYGQTYSGYLKAWQDITHNDMTYYFTDILKGLTPEKAQELKNPDYPTFVPVSCVFQTGRSYIYDGEKRYIDTMQPYEIQYNKPFTVDLNEYTTNGGQYASGSIVLPDGFSYVIKNVSDPEYGKIEPTDQSGIYTYIPDPNKMRSGKITVTLGVTKNDGAFDVDDIELTLEFNQTREMNKMTLERTTYTYDEGKAYTDATEAFEKNYAGYKSKAEGDNINKTQNCNTDIWYTNQSGDEVPANSVVELKGKIHVDETAKYRIAIRGRWNVALFVSFNGGRTYEKACSYIQTSTSDYNFSSAENTYKDYELKSGDWVHFKAVMITGQKGSRASFIGVGWGKFTPELVLYDEEGNIISTTPESIKIGYASAYRSSYEFPETDFVSDYFYTRKENYNYQGDTEIVSDSTHKYVEDQSNYIPWEAETQQIENLFDGKPDTGIHFSGAWGVSETKPAILTFDAGKSITANSLTLYKYAQNSLGYRAFPRNFTFSVSDDGKEYTEIGRWTGLNAPSGASTTLTFNERKTYTFRYYKIIVTATMQEFGGRVALNGLELSYTFRLTGNGDNFFAPSNDMFRYEGTWGGMQTQSSFGHVYVGSKNAVMSFTFNGTRLAILSSNAYGKEFEVYIDGEKLDSTELKKDDSPFAVSYISPKLENKNHNVVVKCIGEANIDSVAIYSEPAD